MEVACGFPLVAGLAQDCTVEFVSCNVRPTTGEEAFWSPFRIIEKRGRIIAVIGLTRLTSAPGMENNGFAFEGLEALDRALADVHAFDPDLVVLLCDLVLQFDTPFLSQLSGVDLILTFGSVDPVGEAGRVPVLYSMTLGRELRWADVGFTGEGPRFAAGGRSVAATLPRDATVQRRLDAFYRRVFEEHGPSAPKPLAGFAAEQDPDNYYVGAIQCKSCHEPEYAQWRRTAHSVAYDLLFSVNRYYIPEYFAYHVTGFGGQGGFNRIDSESPLANVGCETCHGPGGVHMESPAVGTIRGAVPREVCAACHRRDWEDFDEQYPRMRERILHQEEVTGDR